MSVETAKSYLETLTDEQRIFLYGIINLNQRNLVLSWDIDQVLAASEIPVLDFCSSDLGVNYVGRKINGYNTVSNWLIEDGIIKKRKDARKYEKDLWENLELIAAAPPNEVLRKFSYAASLRGIQQFVTTSRIPELGHVTDHWVEGHFSWIPKDHINQRVNRDLKGEIYKAIKVAEIYRRNPEVVHFDDSMNSIYKISQIVPEIGLIGFPYSGDDVSSLQAKTRIFLARDLFEQFLYYNPQDIPPVSHNLDSPLLVS